MATRSLRDCRLPRPRRQTGAQVRVDAEFQNRFRALLLGFALLILLFAAGLSLSVSYFITNPGLLPISAWIPAAAGAISLAGCFFIYKLCDRISHRYCGPLVPILRALDAIRRGERPPPIRLRAHDEYHRLATGGFAARSSTAPIGQPGLAAGAVITASVLGLSMPQ